MKSRTVTTAFLSVNLFILLITPSLSANQSSSKNSISTPVTSLAQEVHPEPSPIVSSAYLQQNFERFERLYREQIFELEKDRSVYWITLEKKAAKGSVLIAPGRTESRLSYFEIAVGLYDQGYNIAILEHPGQGKSYRFVSSSDVGHINSFEDYKNAFEEFVKRAEKKLTPPFHLYASSMGGAISLLSPITNERFQKIVLSAPMFEIKTLGIPSSVVDFFLLVKGKLAGLESYAPFTGPFDPKTPFEKNRYANSPERFQFNNELYDRNPGFRVGGPSVQWVQWARTVPEKLNESIRSFTQPVLILQSDQDDFVRNETQIDFCRRMGRCEIQVLTNSRHALQLDRDENVSAVIRKTAEHFLRP